MSMIYEEGGDLGCEPKLKSGSGHAGRSVATNLLE